MRCMESLEMLGLERDIDYVFNVSYYKLTDWSNRPLRFDFRFLNHKIIIETDGSQHYFPTQFGKTTKEQALINFNILKECDKIKDDFCKKFGYKMIRIPYTEICNMLTILHCELDHILEY